MSRIIASFAAAGLCAIMFSAKAVATPPQSLYYVQAGAPACKRLQSLKKVPSLWRVAAAAHSQDFAALDCVWLSSNARVTWDGVRHEFYFAHITTADHRTLVVYGNDLGTMPYRDPLRREFRTAAGAIACANPFRLSEASQAVETGNPAWLRESGCVRLPAGIGARRIIPDAAKPGVWQVRLHDGAAGKTVWIQSDDLDEAP